nr:MAG TPA: tail sheath protein [Caudoviricetes sp.]
MPVVSCAKTSLPRSLDVPVSLSRSVAETATDMTMMCFVTPGVAFPPGNDRVQFFSTFDAVQGAVPENSEAIFAAQAFFNRSDRPRTMCIGRVFTNPTNGTLVSGPITLSNLANVQNGGFTISVGDASYTVANLTFGLNPTMTDVIRQLNTQMSDFANTVANADGESLTITTKTVGDGSDISYAGTPTEFTDVSPLLKLTSATGASIENGEETTENTPAKLVSGAITDLSGLENLTDGSFDIEVDGAKVQVRDVTTGDSVTLATLATALNSKMSGKATFTVDTPNNQLILTTASASTRTASELAYAVTASSAAGTDISALLKLTQSTATSLVQGTATNVEHPAELTSGEITLADLYNVTDGAMTLVMNGATVNLYGLNFATYGSSLTLNEVVQILTAAIGSNVLVEVSGQSIVISTNQKGESVTIGYASSASSITDLSAILALTQSTAASRIDGYTPGGLVSEVALIQTAARCAGRSVFAWTLDRQYRDTQDQKDFADWAEAQDQAYFSACTNSVQAYNTADTTNIGFYAHNKGYIKTSVMYHNNPQVYPDVSYAALALSVNYALENSTLTMKFKQLTGIETVPLTETQLSSLKARRINTYVSMGNSSSVVREGVQSADSWFTDSHVNLSNYKEELQVEVFNVFMRNKKVKYTSAGQDLLVSAAAKINNRYIRNGTFADREEETTDNETGYTTLPACTITPAPIYSATTSERANRVAPPIAIVAYEAGAFHSVAIDVTVYN